MKIMFFSELAIGGAEKVAAILTGQFAVKQHQVSVITFSNREGKSYYVDDNIDVFSAEIKKETKFRVVRRWLKVREIVKQVEPECIICLATGGIYPLLAAKSIKGKLILSERSNPNKNMGKKEKLNKWISFKWADLIVFQTEYAKQQYSEKIQKKGIVIPNPLALDLPPVYTGIREKRVAAVGRMITAKNYPMMFSAFKKFVLRYPEYVLEVYGNGPKEQEYRRLVEQDDVLKEKVIFKGFVINVNEKIKACAMYISSSNHEGLSNSMLEALALGLPTISTDCPAYGAREYIKNNETGILVPIGDIEGLYSAMCSMVEKDWLNKDFSANSENIRRKLNAAAIADCWLKIIEEIVETERGISRDKFR